MLTKSLLKFMILVLIIESSEQRHEISRIPQSRNKILQAIDGHASEEILSLEFCAMSSGHDTCSMAIDGDINQHEWSNECAITKSESKPWFRARLETPAFVTKVIIYAQDEISDKGRDALTNFELWADYMCVWHQSEASFRNKTFSCDHFTDNIEIKSLVDGAVLGLCEVAVYGKKLKMDWSSGGQSILKVQDCGNGDCHAIDDGKMDTCYETNHPATKQVIHIRLLNPSAIKRIKVFTRRDSLDSLKNFEVEVGNHICHKYHGEAKEMLDFACNVFGHVITMTVFFVEDKNLVICELQATGLPTKLNAFLAPELLGCFQERRHHRDMKQLAAINGMSVYKCEAICRRYQKPYFGMQYGSQCWCSERFGIYGRLSDEQCWMQCHGEPCGAKLANSVYKLQLDNIIYNATASGT